jgi:branched-chain amino acid transport system ATP-binding protein
MAPLLEVEDVRAGYRGLEALHGVDLQVQEGETLAVMGANGAGKSTLLKVVAGLLSPRAGRVRYDGVDVTRTAAFDRVAAGIVLVPEGRRLFPTLTVRENLLLGAYRKRPGPWSVDAVIDLFPMLAERIDRPALRLSGGEQQAAAIGRALMGNPRLVLLDEVSLGLAPVVVKRLYADLPRIRDAGTTVLVVEQDVSQALAVADHVVLLRSGSVVLRRTPDRLDLPTIRHAYFGAA